jgi:hypothetical protein
MKMIANTLGHLELFEEKSKKTTPQKELTCRKPPATQSLPESLKDVFNKNQE